MFKRKISITFIFAILATMFLTQLNVKGEELVYDNSENDVVTKMDDDSYTLKITKVNFFAAPSRNRMYSEYRQLAGAKFIVSDEDDNIVGEIVTDENGEGQLSGLELKTYFVKEIEAPKGYKLSEEVITVHMEDSYENVLRLTIENKPLDPTINKKVNEDDVYYLDNFYDDINFDLNISMPVDTYNLSNLKVVDTFDDALRVSSASVFVDGVRDDYLSDKVEIENQVVTFEVENTYEKPLSNYKGKDITIKAVTFLKYPESADAIKRGYIDNSATLTFNKESEVDSNIVTVYLPTEEVEANKVWEGGTSEKPDVYLKLWRRVLPVPSRSQQANQTSEFGYYGGWEPVGEIIKLVSGKENAIWGNLPKFNDYGRRYEYKVQEVNQAGDDLVLDDYIKEEDGLTVVNKYNYIDIPVEKVWEGKALEEVEIILLEDNVEIDRVTLNENNGFKDIFKLIKYEKYCLAGYGINPLVSEESNEANEYEAGEYYLCDDDALWNKINDEGLFKFPKYKYQEIKYGKLTIEEVAVEGYETEIKGSVEEGFKVINKEIEVEVPKPDPTPDPTPDPNPDPTPGPNPDPEPTPNPKPEVKPEDPKEPTTPPTGLNSESIMYLNILLFSSLILIHLKKKKYI